MYLTKNILTSNVFIILLSLRKLILYLLLIYYSYTFLYILLIADKLWPMGYVI